jgi:imidazolonepropionase-like amidohydrolase
MMRFCLVLLPLLLAACATPGSAPATADLAIAHVTVVDVENGRLLPDQTVLIVGNRIAQIAPSARSRISSGVQVIQAHGKHLIPGLWDMHAHALGDGREDAFFPALLAYGVTGVRNMHTTRPLAEIAALKQAILRGERLGPRIMAAGPLLDGRHEWNHRGTFVVETPEAAVRAVDSLVAAGADFIKVYDALSPDAYRAIATEAKRRGIAFAGHIPNGIRPEEAAAAGQHSVEHMDGLDQPCEPEAMATGCDSVVAAYVKHQTWQVPTLSLYWSRTVADSLLSDAGRTAVLSSRRIENWRGMRKRATPTDRDRWEDEYRALLNNLKRLHRAGVPILAGTDMPNPMVVPGISLHDELVLLVEAGLTTLEALQAATSRPAQYFGAADSLGSVSEGKFADLVLLGANPLENIRNTRRIDALVLNGRYLDRGALDRLLEQAKAAAKVSPL